jgi:site-specific DNA recombinase
VLAAENGAGSSNKAAVAEWMGAAARRLAEIREEIDQLAANLPADEAVAAALADFDAMWESLTPREQGMPLGLLIGQVDYDVGLGNVAITFQMTSLKALEAAPDLRRPRHEGEPSL